MKKLYIAFLFFTLLIQPVLPQQDPLSNHYMFNTLTYNPGVAGISGRVCATAIFKQQWLGFDGAPTTNVFNISTPVAPFKIKSGIGVFIQQDNIGFDNDLNIDAIYSYHMDVGQGKLGIGLSVGIYNMSLSPEWKIPGDDDHTRPESDPLIPASKESVTSFDAGFGLYYKAEKYYVSLSSTHLNQPEIKFAEGQTYIVRHYYLTSGYNLQLPNPSLELLPSFFVYSDGKATQFTITSLVRYNKKLWGGVSYREGDALIGIAGFELNNGLKIGYSYDFTLSDIRKNSGGSHELMVNYCFDLSFGKSPMKYKSIRFL